MDDRTAFERQVAGEFVRRAGPVRPVDAAAIFGAITAARSPKWRFQSMFSATKLIVAGAIVALFGSFLLAGVLPQQGDDLAPAAVTSAPSPSTTEALLARMVTEVVEPGVLRVLDDGAGHDLVAGPPGGVTVAPDGAVWLLRALAPEGVYGWSFRLDALFELGRQRTYDLTDALASKSVYGWPAELAVDSDGVVWLDAEGDLLSFAGSTIEHEAAPAQMQGLARWLPDGAARLVSGAWTLTDEPHSGAFAAGGGSAWSAPELVMPGEPFYRYDGDRWEAMELPATLITRAGSTEFAVHALAVGEDGTLWASLGVRREDDAFEPYLIRYADGDWSVYGEEEGVPILEWHTYASRMAVDGAGRLWIAPGNGDGWPAYLNDELGAADRPVGVLAFDGQRWSRFLDGIQVNRVAIAHDGTVYATGLNGCTDGESLGPEGYGCAHEAMDPSPAGLYVITSEAAAAPE